MHYCCSDIAGESRGADQDISPMHVKSFLMNSTISLAVSCGFQREFLSSFFLWSFQFLFFSLPFFFFLKAFFFFFFVLVDGFPQNFCRGGRSTSGGDSFGTRICSSPVLGFVPLGRTIVDFLTITIIIIIIKSGTVFKPHACQIGLPRRKR